MFGLTCRTRFWLTIDAALDSKIEVPWPFYRVEPFEAAALWDPQPGISSYIYLPVGTEQMT